MSKSLIGLILGTIVFFVIAKNINTYFPVAKNAVVHMADGRKYIGVLHEKDSDFFQMDVKNRTVLINKSSVKFIDVYEHEITRFSW